MATAPPRNKNGSAKRRLDTKPPKQQSSRAPRFYRDQSNKQAAPNSITSRTVKVGPTSTRETKKQIVPSSPASQSSGQISDILQRLSDGGVNEPEYCFRLDSSVATGLITVGNIITVVDGFAALWQDEDIRPMYYVESVLLGATDSIRCCSQFMLNNHDLGVVGLVIGDAVYADPITSRLTDVDLDTVPIGWVSGFGAIATEYDIWIDNTQFGGSGVAGTQEFDILTTYPDGAQILFMLDRRQVWVMSLADGVQTKLFSITADFLVAR